MTASEQQAAAGKKDTKDHWFSRLRAGLAKTRHGLTDGLAGLVRPTGIDESTLETLEDRLLMSDVGITVTTRIIDQLKKQKFTDTPALIDALRKELAHILRPSAVRLDVSSAQKPFVILVIGVNGAGKTTTIAKLTQLHKNRGLKVMLAAGDTFRAAAIEQLQVWGNRHDVPVIAQTQGADSASVIFDAHTSAKSRAIDVLLADTAGRLHNKEHLMEELRKIKRVLTRQDPDAPHEVLMVLDACTGQNALSQLETFNSVIGITGLVLTKLDGTAKGGLLFAIADRFGIPVRYIGVGENADDLREFDADDFIDALLEDRT
ncbi:MAG: hypothetical protein BMS9Abin15_0425 [Gammaproteobacteria bacterium]|nr:MAG: hypothetical protein BMS9Abin15_0425 [Gammaproteobacteria bacterium]